MKFIITERQYNKISKRNIFILESEVKDDPFGWKEMVKHYGKKPYEKKFEGWSKILKVFDITIDGLPVMVLSNYQLWAKDTEILIGNWRWTPYGGFELETDKEQINRLKIRKNLEDAASYWGGTKAKIFVDIKREFDPKDKDDQYWLKEIDKHFYKQMNIITNFASGKHNNDKSLGEPEPTKTPTQPKTIAKENKEGWEEIKKYYKATPLKKQWGKELYELIEITHQGKKFFLRNDGEITNSNITLRVGNWSWKNNKPILKGLEPTTKSVGYIKGEEDECEKSFCEEDKIVGRGASGYCVKQIQTRLLIFVDGIQITKDLQGCKKDSELCDGVYGKETEKAVIQFQRKKGISDDGVFYLM